MNGCYDTSLGASQAVSVYIDQIPLAHSALTSHGVGFDMERLEGPRSQVLDHDDRPIPGLYACGNDMNSAVGGRYIGAGITLGPALTFGYLAAMAPAGRTQT